MLSMTSRVDGPRVTAEAFRLSSEKLISTFLPRPDGLRTREVEGTTPEAPNREAVRTVFLRDSGSSESRTSTTDLPGVGRTTRENPSLPGAFVFSGSALGFSPAFDLGGGGGFFSPSRQLRRSEQVSLKTRWIFEYQMCLQLFLSLQVWLHLEHRNT